jgi:hypothetical protein
MPVVCIANQHLYCSRLCATCHGENAGLFDDVQVNDIPFGRHCDNCGRLLSTEVRRSVDLVVQVEVATNSEDVDVQGQARSFILGALDTHRKLTTSFFDKTVRDIRRVEVTARLVD